MFEDNDEKTAREQILAAIKDYNHRFHKPFAKNNRIPYAAQVWDDKEVCNLAEVALDFWITSGKWAARFEENLGTFLNVPYVSLVNSGSSANLLAFMALTSPLLGERAIARGDEVITVAMGFPTTVTPIVQYGAVPVFVDVTIPQYNVDLSCLEAALSKRTKAVMLAHTLGNPFDAAQVLAFCKAHGLWLIEDNCDALGSRVDVNGEERLTGTIGHIGTSSFYPPHHITCGEGGAVYTKDPLLHKILRSLRDWGRDCVCRGGEDNHCGHRFEGQHGTLPQGYDHKYVYSHFGYNLKATDMQAAIGVAQLEKAVDFVAARRKNWAYLREGLSDLKDSLILPDALPLSKPSWFGFLLSCKKGGAATRNQITCYLEDQDIQTRNLFAGNLIRHPCFCTSESHQIPHRVVGTLENTDFVLNNTFWIGVYPGMTRPMLDRMIEQVYQGVAICK